MSVYDDLTELPVDGGQLFDRAAQELAQRGEWHRLFDLRLMQTRRNLGLPWEHRGSISDVESSLRDQLEDGYLAACREVGQLLVDAGRFRDAWMYLRPAGDKQLVRDQLARIVPDDDNADELIELSLYEGIDPERGFAWQLGRHGTCNSITALEGLHAQLDRDGVEACAAVLLRHVYNELRGNLRGHLHRLEGAAPEDLSVVQLIDRYPQLLADGSYHLDASHLASTVRFARVLTDEGLLRRAVEICQYGRRLHADLQFPGEPPFEDVYPSNLLFFQALLGDEVDEAVAYFTEQARREASAGEDAEATAFGTTSASVETLLVLLTRIGRFSEALVAYGELAPEGRELSPQAPTPLELAQRSGDWEAYLQICRQRDDVMGYAAGQAAAREQGA